MRVQEFGMLISIFHWEAGCDIKKESVWQTFDFPVNIFGFTDVWGEC